MLTSDGYTVKTYDPYPISCKSQYDYNFPLTAIVSTPVYTAAPDAPKIYTAVVDP